LETHKAFDFLALLENNERGNALDSILGGQQMMIVNIDFNDGGTAPI